MSITFIRHFEQESHRVVDSPIRPIKNIPRLDGVPDLVICSPYLRCRQTADSYAEFSTLQMDPRICEYQGHKKQKKFALDKSTMYLFETGKLNLQDIPTFTETWEECRDRIDEFVVDLCKLSLDYKNILVVTHGVIVRYLELKLCGDSPFKRGRDVDFGGGFTVNL